MRLRAFAPFGGVDRIPGSDPVRARCRVQLRIELALGLQRPFVAFPFLLTLGSLILLNHFNPAGTLTEHRSTQRPPDADERDGKRGHIHDIPNSSLPVRRLRDAPPGRPLPEVALPAAPLGLSAGAGGQVDTTRLDILADFVDGTIGRPELTISVDIATRAILAAELRPHTTKTVDVALLLTEMTTPHPARPTGQMRRAWTTPHAQPARTGGCGRGQAGRQGNRARLGRPIRRGGYRW